MIIDTHTHFYDPTRPQGVPWPAPDSGALYRTVLPEHYKALTGPQGASGTVVVEASAWLEDNQWILDLAADEPFIVGLVGHIDPGRPDFAAHLARFAPHPLFLGLRVGRGYFGDIDAGGFMADIERLAAEDLVLDVLLGTDELPAVAALASRLPRLRIVVNHVAHVPIDGKAPDPRWLEGMALAASHDAVYCKVSGLVEASTVQPAPDEADFYRPTLDALWDLFGDSRLVYGSNWPVSERAAPLDQVQRIAWGYFAAKGGAAAENFHWKNAQAAYRYVSRAD